MAAPGCRGGGFKVSRGPLGVEAKDPLPGCDEFIRDFADLFGQAFPGLARPLRAGDGLRWRGGAGSRKLGGVAVADEPGASVDVIPVQGAAHGEDLQLARRVGVGDPTTPLDAALLVPLIAAVQPGRSSASWRWLIVPRLTPLSHRTR